MYILHIDSCALGDHSASRRCTAATTAALAAAHAGARVVYRDLAAAPLSHVSGPLLQVMRQQWDSTIPMNAELRAEVLQGESLLREFLDAEVVVLGAPLHNFSIPSTLKAWLDRLLQGRRRFEPMRSGHPGLLHGKRIVLVSTHCRTTAAEPQEQQMDQHEMNLCKLFAHMGVTLVETVRTDAVPETV